MSQNEPPLPELLKDVLIYVVLAICLLSIPLYFHFTLIQTIIYGVLIFFGWVSFKMRHYVSGVWRMRQGNYDSAYKQLEKATKTALGSVFRVSAALNICYIHTSRDQFEEALVWIQKTLDTAADADKGIIYITAASIYLQRSQPDQILEMCDLAEAQEDADRNAYDIHYNRVTAYTMLMDFERGQHELSQLMALSPPKGREGITEYAAAYLLYNCERYKEAIQPCLKMLEMNISPSYKFIALLLLVHTYREIKSYDHANHHLERAETVARIGEAESTILINRIHLDIETNQTTPQTITQIEEIESHITRTQELYYLMVKGLLYYQHDQIESAIEILKNALDKIDPRNIRKRVEIYYHLGFIYFEQQMIDDWSKICDNMEIIAPQSKKFKELSQLGQNHYED